MGHVVQVAPGQDQGPLLNHIALGLYVTAVVFVALRFISRGFLVKKFGLDDLFIAVAAMLGGLQTTTLFMQIAYGTGRHSNELNVAGFNEMLKYSWLNMLTYFVAIWTVKMSILAMYYRIGSGMRGIPWIAQGPAVWITAVFITLSAVANFLAQFLICFPVSRAWDIERQSQGCANLPLFMQASAAINVATDVVLLVFPLPLLPLLKVNKKQQTALAVIFSVGLIPVVASTMRLCEIVMAGNPVMVGKTWQEEDSSWTWAWIPIWSHIEVEVGILVASLPSLNPLVKQMCAGTSTRRSLTPSELPDFPDYQADWSPTKLSSNVDFDGEKSHKNTSFYDESSDFEDEIGVAKATSVRTMEKPLAAKATGSRKWWKRQK